mgnify:CR=1 FL=1
MGVVFSKIKKKKQRKKQRKKQQKKHFKYASSPRYYRSKNIYTLNTKPVTVRYIGYNGDNTLPKFSYTYKGVPGGFYT